MNVNFEMAMRYINLGSYEKAENALKAAIDEEIGKNNGDVAAEYRCVLGELLANLDRKDDAAAELKQVYEYCGKKEKLSRQREIAEKLLVQLGAITPDSDKKAAPEEKSTAQVIEDLENESARTIAKDLELPEDYAEKLGKITPDAE